MQASRLLREECQAGCHRDPLASSSVHGWSQSLSISSSPLLLLPIGFLCSLSSNSVAIQELRRDPSAASSVIIKTPISSEDGFGHLNCLFRAHVTSNGPCVALLCGEWYELLLARQQSVHRLLRRVTMQHGPRLDTTTARSTLITPIGYRRENNTDGEASEQHTPTAHRNTHESQ